jgi:ketosteroid isomerase-like protein
VTSNQSRATALIRAINASIDGDIPVLTDLFAEDVVVWSPAFSGRGLSELMSGLNGIREAFSQPEAELTPLEVGGDFACVEWCISLLHSGPLVLSDDWVIEATGLRVVVHGVTVAEFDRERICALRQYWNEFTLLEQLGMAVRH